MVPGAIVADIARRYGTTRWQVYGWRKKLRSGALVVPECTVDLPLFAELVVDDRMPLAMPASARSDVEIVVGDVVIRAGCSADEGQLTRAIRAARTALS